MSIKIYKIKEYNYKSENRLFNKIINVLYDICPENEDAILIGNCSIDGVWLDALLFTRHGVRIFDFKNYEGNIVACENGRWTCDGKIIEGGANKRTPLLQAQTERSHVANGLWRYLKKDLRQEIKAMVAFPDMVTLDNRLSPNIQCWLSICNKKDLYQTLKDDFSGKEIFSIDEFSSISALLQIEHFEIVGEISEDGKSQKEYNDKKDYSAYTIDEFFTALEQACQDQYTIEHKYEILRATFYRAVEQKLVNCQLSFSGLFAKVDYLIKENNIPTALAHRIHDTRRILFPQGNKGFNDEGLDLSRSFPHDLKAICQFLSFIFDGKGIPACLQDKFPTKDRKSSWGRFDENMVRVLVEEWDDEYIYATEEVNGAKVIICYSESNQFLSRNGKGDWSYIREILSKGTQLNLVRIRIEDSIIYPELIIFEPDYLINITTIASCFDDAYKESPFINLINKVKQDSPTIPIHLGNLAGQFLDETIHERDITFSESFNEFFRKNALSMVACTDMQDPQRVREFYENAKIQKANISKLIGSELPREIGEFNTDSVILEPSFFSEVLGIQGRLDFLYEHKGKTIILEQKSGKGAFVPGQMSNPDIPNIQTKHLVQLLLYRALFIYEFKKSAEDIKYIFLLYSKYNRGLLSTTQYPELFLRAIRIRNLLTWCEISYANEGMGILDTIRPDNLRSSSVNDKFWCTWKLPELMNVLDPIQKASPIEKAYYFRFLRFLAKEQILSKIGNKTKDNSGFASKWLDTFEEKKDAGNIYDGLRIISTNESKGEVSSVTLSFSQEQSADTSNFRMSDVVILYPYIEGEVPNACAQMVHRASIVDITTTNVTLRLRNGQTDSRVFAVEENIRWAIEHDMFEASTSGLYQGMQRFLSATKDRRDMILGQRELRIDPTLEIKGEYGPFNILVRHAKQSRDLFIVVGPPGTGKTSFGLLNILQEELLEEGSNILLLSYTNRAVDEICSKLKADGIDFIRIGSELSCSAEYKPYLLENRVQDCPKGADVRNLIKTTRVFCGTTAALNANISLLSIKQFSLAIVDESSQILEPHLVGLLSAKCNGQESIGRLVLIGDHKQLPAVVQQTADESLVTEPELRSIGLTDCRLSFFERQIRNFKNNDGSYDEKFVYMLTRQGRMHKEIAEFPNIAFYGSKLEIVGSPILPHQDLIMPSKISSSNGIDMMLMTRAVSFVATPYPENSTSDKVNIIEADMIAATVIHIYNIEKANFDINKTIGIIVPYRNQISTIRNAIDKYGISALHDITIDTVERYQGSQREYILYGFTIQRKYQLNFLSSNVFEEDGMIIDRKLNVAMTRARLHLIIYGNPFLLNENYTFSHLIEFIQNKKGFINVSPEDFCEGRFSISPSTSCHS
ncbi:MAG: AAA family ATPase [Bacteroidaceae bacterium]|nr:AAA family ATPase [Bacteroidaceae bacterium]